MSKWRGQRILVTKASFLANMAVEMHSLLQIYKDWAKTYKSSNLHIIELGPKPLLSDLTKNDLIYIIWDLYRNGVIRFVSDGDKGIVLAATINQLPYEIQQHLSGGFDD